MFPEVIRQEWLLLTFRNSRIDLRRHKMAFLGFAIVATWLAGIGRYWDHPSAHWWQYAGLGSIVYVGVLSLLLWVLILPLRPKHWSFLSVYVFVGLTAPPAWLYAIPVERFMPLETAIKANMVFLLFVATWRVALYGLFLRRAAGLTGFAWLAALFLPLALIVNALTMLNLEHAVFEIMGGLRERTASDGAYFVVIMLTLISYIVSPALLACYAIGCVRAWKHNVVLKKDAADVA
ncbi:MAG TPA: hypothetical protein VNJ47_01415 [Nevskiales bacterium]|nr:hypothetical protein [Nevskiales bacterium]